MPGPEKRASNQPSQQIDLWAMFGDYEVIFLTVYRPD
jgi:hypothetical protein